MKVSTFPGGARRLGHAVRELPGTWRGSLQLRVVSATMLLSVLIAVALGWVLNSQIRDGLVKAKESSSLSAVSSGVDEARRLIANAKTAGPGSGGSGVVDDHLWTQHLFEVVTSLCSGASDKTYQVLVVTDPRSSLFFDAINCGDLLPSSIPAGLATEVKKRVDESGSVQWTTTELKYSASLSTANQATAVNPDASAVSTKSGVR